MKQLTRLFLLLLSINVLADCLPVKVRNAEGNYIVPGTQGDIVYARVNGQELALDAYVQKRGNNRPAVMVIHGGGFTSGSRVSFIGQFLEMLTSAGYNWFAMDYRKNGISNYKESLDDVRAALAFVRCNAKEFRTDPERIALLGEDTGATLAALLAAEKPAGVKANVLVGGVYEPLTNVSRGVSATLLIHGAGDQEVPLEQCRRFFADLREADIDRDFIVVENAIHRPENWRPEQWIYKQPMIGWLNEKLNLKKADHEPYKTTWQKDIPYRIVGRQEWLGLDAYVPKGRGPFPAVIIAHGGGWEAGDKVTYATPLFEPLAKAGFAWFSINYRLTPESRHQEQLDDVRAAIRFVREHAKDYNVDPNRIALLGESASGQMVSYLATNGQVEREQGTQVAAVVSFYGVYDLAAMVKDNSPRALHARLFGLTELNDQAWRLLRRYSPLHNLDMPRPRPTRNSAMPPLLLICGTKDRLYQQQEAFAQKLKTLRENHETFAVEGAPHGIENWEGHPEWMHYKKKLVEWLRVQLRH
jgi:alpha-L-fucosidase 2